jgi:Methylamine utilisation protein MauE
VPDLLAVPFFVAASLLVLGGLAKVRRPAPASRALAAARLPNAWWQVRALGALEATFGTWALVAPGATSALAVAALYLAFAVFLGVLIAAHVPAASCGCAGAADVPPSILHVSLNLVAVGTAVAAAASPPPSIGAFLAEQPLAGVPLVIGMATAWYAAYLAVGPLPVLLGEVRRSSALGHRHDHHDHDHEHGRHGRLQVAPLERSA